MVLSTSFRFAFIFIGALLAGLAGGCATDQKVQEQANAFDGNLKRAEIQNSVQTAYFQQIGARILEAAKASDAAHFGPKTHFEADNSWMFKPEDIQFHLVNSETLNAFTTGGVHVYVYNKLFQQCSTEDELAAVMAHEFGHIYCRHVQKGMNRQMALMGLSGAAGVAGYAAGGSQSGAQYAQYGASVAAMVGQFANMGFTRGDEAQADEMGFHFYVLAGWDPRQFGAFFQHMIDMGLDKTPEMMSDHPSLKSRVEAANKRVAQLQARGTIDKFRRPNIATPEQFQRAKQVAVQSAAAIPNDQQVLTATKMLQALPRSCWVPYDPPDQLQARKELLDMAQKMQAQSSSK